MVSVKWRHIVKLKLGAVWKIHNVHAKLRIMADTLDMACDLARETVAYAVYIRLQM